MSKLVFLFTTHNPPHLNKNNIAAAVPPSPAVSTSNPLAPIGAGLAGSPITDAAAEAAADKASLELVSKIITKMILTKNFFLTVSMWHD